MRLVPFAPEHLTNMQLSAFVITELKKYPSAEILEALSAEDLAYTAIVGGGSREHVLGIMGAVPIEEGCAVEVFVIADIRRRKYTVAFVKAVKELLERIRARFAVVEAIGEDETPDRWFEWLGFERVDEQRWRLS